MKFTYRTVVENSTYSHVDVPHWLCTVRERTGSIDVWSLVVSGTRENNRIKRQCANRDKEKKRQSNENEKNARHVRSEDAAIYLRFEVTKTVWNVGDYLPWIFSNTSMKISKVGNKKKQKQNNVDHSSQLLLTQGVLCYSRRRKKIASVRTERQRAYEFALARSQGWASLASQLFDIFLLKHATVCCQELVPTKSPHIPQTLHWPSSSASSMLYSICVKLPVVRRTVSL